MATDRIVSEVQGIIACSNDRGVKLDGETEWRNLSRWAEVAAIPGKGAVVVLGLDKSGYIREISTASDVARSATLATSAPTATGEFPQLGAPDKDVQIARMNAITNAINLLATNGIIDVNDVLQVAARLEAWVLR